MFLLKNTTHRNTEDGHCPLLSCPSWVTRVTAKKAKAVCIFVFGVVDSLFQHPSVPVEGLQGTLWSCLFWSGGNSNETSRRWRSLSRRKKKQEFHLKFPTQSGCGGGGGSNSSYLLILFPWQPPPTSPGYEMNGSKQQFLRFNFSGEILIPKTFSILGGKS